jgi:hypothetical protein
MSQRPPPHRHRVAMRTIIGSSSAGRGAPQRRPQWRAMSGVEDRPRYQRSGVIGAADIPQARADLGARAVFKLMGEIAGRHREITADIERRIAAYAAADAEMLALSAAINFRHPSAP